MPDGELRRPPQLWEQRLARQTAILSVGISSNGDATAIVPPTPTPGTDGGIEPAPVLPPPGDFIAPSQPTLLKQVQAINVLWDGLNSDGELWPYDTSWVEIHMSTTSGFSPSSTTLKGRLARPGIYSVGGLSSGTTYYFKLRGADPAGNVTDASAQASSTTGSATSSDIISISADKVTAGTVTGLYIAGGTIAGGYLSGGTISGGYITGGTLNAGYINGGTVNGALVTGGTIQSSADSNRVVLSSGNKLVFYSSSNAVANVYTASGNLEFGSDNDFIFGNIDNANTGTDLVKFIDKGGFSGHRLTVGDANDADAIYLDTAEVRLRPVYDQESANAANVRVGSDVVDYRLARSTSTVRVKDSLISIGDPLEGVPAEKLADFEASVDPYDVLTVSPTEFESLCEFDGGVRILGFIAEDVAAKFPWAAAWDDDGNPLAVEDRPIVAALLSVVKDQQAAISDLRARIEALEA